MCGCDGNSCRPTSVLGGHKAGIIDIKIQVERRFVFSYGKDAVIKLWDLDKATIIQTLGLHFPSFSVLGKEIEFGRPGLYIDTGTPDTVIVICCEHLTELRLLEERYSSQEVGLLAAPDAESKEETSSEEDNEDDVEEEEEEIEETKTIEPAKKDLTSVIKVNLLKEEMKIEDEALEEDVISPWTSTREIVARRRIKRLEMNPDKIDKEMPDFNKIPLPKYEPFKIFREPQIGVGEKTLNQLRVEKYLDTTKFKQLAKDNMPFMALEIHGLQEVKIAPGLPLSENMINRGIKIDTIDDLMAANLNWKIGQNEAGIELETRQESEDNGSKKMGGKQSQIAKSLSPISEPAIPETDGD